MTLPLTPETTVRDLLTTHPELFAVLEKYGMCPDCKADPPTVPLRHFAIKHCGGDVDALIRELCETAKPLNPWSRSNSFPVIDLFPDSENARYRKLSDGCCFVTFGEQHRKKRRICPMGCRFSKAAK